MRISDWSSDVCSSDLAAVLRLLRALHDARLLAELPTHLHDHRTAGPADGLPAEGAEQVRQHAADEQTAHPERTLQTELHVENVDQVAKVHGLGREQHDSGGAGRDAGPATADSPRSETLHEGN